MYPRKCRNLKKREWEVWVRDMQHDTEEVMSCSGADSGAGANLHSSYGPKLNRDWVGPTFPAQLIGCRHHHLRGRPAGGVVAVSPLLPIPPDPSHSLSFKTRGWLSGESRAFHPSQLKQPHAPRISSDSSLSSQQGASLTRDWSSATVPLYIPPSLGSDFHLPTLWMRVASIFLLLDWIYHLYCESSLFLLQITSKNWHVLITLGMYSIAECAQFSLQCMPCHLLVHLFPWVDL